MDRQPAVYILASRRNATLYIGVTSDLTARVWHRKNDLVKGFTRQYRVHSLVYFECHSTMVAASAREKQLKKWRRAWKVRLIEESNLFWQDLSAQLLG